MLLAALPLSWEAPIIVTVMAGGQVAGITLETTKTTIICYADAERAKNIGKRPPKAHKISAVKHKGKTPSFPQQAAPNQGGRPQKRKDKRGQHGKGKGKGQGYGNLHFTDTISRAPSTAHSVATITPQGLLQRIEVEAPDTSSFGNGPYPSFNHAMRLADRLGVPKHQRTVQCLEQSVLMQVDIPGPSTFPGSAQDLPDTAPTPEGSRPSSPRSPIWPHMTESEKAGIVPLVRFLTRPRAATEPPHVPHDISNDDEDMGDIVSLPDEEGNEDPSLWGGNYVPAFDLNDTRASGFNDLYEACGDEGYVTLPLNSDYSPNSLTVTTFNCERLSAQDIVILKNHICNCPKASCLKCKGLAPCSIEPGWMMDSRASNHFTPLKSDFLSYRPFPSPERANTAANPLKILGSGSVLIQYELEKKGKSHEKIVRL